VALTPAGVRELVDAGHEVYVQSGAGLGSAISDEMYEAQGASIPSDAAAVFGEAELIVKVKEPSPPRWRCSSLATRCSPTCTWPRR